MDSQGAERFAFSGSILQASHDGTIKGARITRSVLKPEELRAQMHVVVAMEMRNAVEFHTRIDGGAKISKSELESRYLPLQSDYDRVSAWLVSEGFVTDKTVDANRLNIFVHHTVSEVGRVFQVRFARVATADGEFTSAVSTPSAPAGYGPAILGVLGLQPHLRFHKHTYSLAKPVGSLVAPTDLRTAYNVPSNLTGAGQTIAIIMQGPGPLVSDLTTFWSKSNVTQSPGNYTSFSVNSGAASPSGAEFEGSLDVEWASGMAPGADVRFYDVPYLDDIDAAAALTQVATDRLTIPNLNEVSMSFGASEWGTTADDNLAFHNIFGVLTNAGVTIFASSGDGGSNPDASGSTSDYGTGSNFPLSAEYPASDPYVTAVGGTDLELNSNGTIETETAWFLDPSNNSAVNATGGGISALYGRPSWQVGSSLPSGTFRVLPDVAADASNVKGSGQYMYVVYENSGTGNLPFTQQASGGSGTSFSSPIWAGICACLNQARSTAGLAPLGLLGPKIYPLLGSSSFHDIAASGTLGNGVYSAGPGYDYLTGLGSPNVANLASALSLSSVNSDFNGDGMPDILWQNSISGEVVLWLTNGTTFSSLVDFGTAPTDWQIAATGNFSGNGMTDILWRNTVTGDVGIWIMNGTSFSSWVDFASVSTQWRIAGTGDFNGDGQTDILWQNTVTGEVGIWLMQGTSVTGWVSLGVDLQWTVAGAGDFTGDGNTDIVWRNNSTGQVAIWLMNGTSFSSYLNLGVVSGDWKIAGIESFNQNADVIWQNSTTGQVGIWLMNRTNYSSWVNLGTVPTGWNIVAH